MMGIVLGTNWSVLLAWLGMVDSVAEWSVFRSDSDSRSVRHLICHDQLSSLLFLLFPSARATPSLFNRLDITAKNTFHVVPWARPIPKGIQQRASLSLYNICDYKTFSSFPTFPSVDSPFDLSFIVFFILS